MADGECPEDAPDPVPSDDSCHASGGAECASRTIGADLLVAACPEPIEQTPGSKRAEKRRLKVEKWEKEKKIKRKQEADVAGSLPEDAGETSTEKPLATAPAAAPEGETTTNKPLAEPTEGGLRRAEKRKAEHERFQAQCQLGTTVVIDCEWEAALQEKEVKSLVQQVLYCYGSLKAAEKPCRLVLTGVQPGSRTLQGLQKLAGFANWVVTVSDKPYIELFEHCRCVYLTAEGESVVENFETEKVYIIGGIVDRNRLKGKTYEKACTQGIATAKLPLDEHVDLGSFSRVLTVNHVLGIVLEHQRCQNWAETFKICLPGRKVKQIIDDNVNRNCPDGSEVGGNGAAVEQKDLIQESPFSEIPQVD